MERCIELGTLSSNSNSNLIFGMTTIQIRDAAVLKLFLNLQVYDENCSIVLIYYKICPDLSTSADFSSTFSSFPLKHVNIANSCFIPFVLTFIYFISLDQMGFHFEL